MIGIDRDREWLPMMNNILKKLKDLENKIDLTKSNTDLMVRSFNKKERR